MRTHTLLLIGTLISLSVNAQSYAVSWGDEMKIKKGSADFHVINADETGVYMTEGRMKAKGFVMPSLETTYSLYKFDKNYKEVYHENYSKELKGLSFNSIRFLKKDMFLFADDYNKRDRTYTVLGMKIDRVSGEPLGMMVPLATYSLDSKKDEFEYVLIPNQDSTQWLLVGDVSTETNMRLSITPISTQLKAAPATNIQFSFDKNSFTLQDVLQTPDGKYLVIGKQFAQVPKSDKSKKMVSVFKEYVFSKYDKKGKKEFDFNTSSGDKFAVNGEAVLAPDGTLSFAGFYSNDRKKNEVNGFFVYKMDLQTGAIKNSAFKEVTAAMMDQAIEDAAEEDAELKTAKKATKNEEDDGISKDFKIRAVLPQPNGSLLLVAELSSYRSYSHTYSNYNSSTKSWSYTTRTYHVFTNSDLLAINTDAAGNIAWMNSLPKKQVETTSGAGPGMNSGYAGFYSGIRARSGMPFFSSFNYLLLADKLIFLMNDNKGNESVVKASDKPRAISSFALSHAYAVALDLATGQFSRKMILSNSKEPIIMPRFSYVVGNDLYVPAMQPKFMGKSEFKLGKISVR